jgi:hypothetical protein
MSIYIVDYGLYTLSIAARLAAPGSDAHTPGAATFLRAVRLLFAGLPKRDFHVEVTRLK